MLQDYDYIDGAAIAIDNQAAIKGVHSRRASPGQHLMDHFLEQMRHIAERHEGTPLDIRWVPGHKGIKGNEKADELAKEAAKGHSNQRCDFPAKLHSPLPCSKPALKMVHNKQIKLKAKRMFSESPRYQRFHAIDSNAPSDDYRKIASALPRHLSSILVSSAQVIANSNAICTK